MFAAGLIDEVKSLLARYGDVEALRAPGYKAVGAFLKGEIDLEEAKRRFVRDDLRLAKRQRTWFRRNPNIHWLGESSKLEQATELVSVFLQRH
jgi:tRNA dimethylallyltransferase